MAGDNLRELIVAEREWREAEKISHRGTVLEGSLG